MIVGFYFRQPPGFEVREKKVQLRKNNFSKNLFISKLAKLLCYLQVIQEELLPFETNDSLSSRV